MICAVDHLGKVSQQYDNLKTTLEAPSVAKLMYEKDALTLLELESVINAKDPGKAAKSLLKIIMKQPERAVYDCFLESLRQTNQDDIFYGLVLPGGRSHV
jgi:hypothetical protein